jgi:hypothetical protein
MNKMFTVWASLAALIVAAPIGKAHATDTPKFADILDSNFESAKGRADFRVTHSCPNARLSRLRSALTTPDGTSSSSTMARRSASGALKRRRVSTRTPDFARPPTIRPRTASAHGSRRFSR